jgi:hypothetical protein
VSGDISEKEETGEEGGDLKYIIRDTLWGCFRAFFGTHENEIIF